jgi:ribose transport system permease protein
LRSQVADEPKSPRRNRRQPRVSLYDAWPYLLLVALIVGMILLRPNLLSMRALETKADNGLTLALMSGGQGVVILTGGIDLSIAGIESLANVLAATQPTGQPEPTDMYSTERVETGAAEYRPTNFLLWAVIILAIGAAAGAINGVIIVRLGISPVITTLATWNLWTGVALFILATEGGSLPVIVTGVATGRLLGVPKSVLILVLVVLAWSLLKRTRFARNIYAVGSDQEHARLMGVNVGRAKIWAYTLSGLLAALAGLYRTVQMASGAPRSGDGFLLLSVAAVVLGGGALSGGRGGIGSSIVGAFSMLCVSDLVFFLGLGTYFNLTAQGLVLIAVVSIAPVVGYLRQLPLAGYVRRLGGAK